MPKPDEYKFKIDVYTPETLPMLRLADYLTELAALLGQPERVHFVRVEHGSATIVQYIDPEAVQKVRMRLAEARNTLDAPKDIRKAVRQINKMLRDDNATGELIRENSNAILFPGRDEVLSEAVGPFNQYTEIEGILVRIGGKDVTARAQIQDPEERIWSCEVRRTLAQDMAEYLYGQPIRVHGEGRWIRATAGNWELKAFRANGFEPLSTHSLKDAVNSLREVAINHWQGIADPQAFLNEVRDNDKVE